MSNGAESYPMNGGDGTFSYSKNSYFQENGYVKICRKQPPMFAKSKTVETIENVLDIHQISTGDRNDTFCIADLGCSVGPNTFVAVQDMVEAVKLKYQKHSCRVPEFQVLFNDHVSNDFNTLFSSLPPGREYFAYGVPGSFHGRLFPSSSLHLARSSYAAQWLSELPEELRDERSPAWNRGKIFYANASDEVHKAYATQYAKDMARFLEARAEELVVGGLVVLLVPSVPDHVPPSQSPIGLMFDLLGRSLVDMAKEGIISEAQVDAFNLPIYSVTPKEMKEIVERNGRFNIERIEHYSSRSGVTGKVTGHALTLHLRAGMEGLISKHFGDAIVDQVFDRFYHKTPEFLDQIKYMNNEGNHLFLVLKRK